MIRNSSRLEVVMLATVALLLAVGLAAASSASVTVRAGASAPLAATILVSGGGYSLYHLTTEKRGSISCTGACRKAWPPLLLASGKPVAGSGLAPGALGTIARPDGGRQVTYDGFALYRYGGDTKPGQLNGQGLASKWFVLAPSGAVVRGRAASGAGSAAHASAPASSSSPSSSTSPPSATTTSVGTDTADGCPQGQTIFSSGNSDDDDDNVQGGASDGDGCV